MLKLLVFLATIGFAAPSASARTLTGSKYLPEAKVDLPTARRTALEVSPGKITSEELEREAGGSGLRYSFDIAVGKVTHEVGIDAKTGQVLKNSIEGPGAD